MAINVAKLKKRAAEFELKKQFDKAVEAYVELLEHFDEYANELDVALFNRVGDILLRQGNVADAVDYYEKAVDKYAEGGFFNNAIALCNKILRHSPGRTSVYYKLGKISAQKGFKTDAKQNFLEYADRMQKAGKIDEAFRALKEFADLCPDQDDIRLMLADQLSRADRKPEAVEQLQLLYERYDAEGRAAEASAAYERMKAIDPTAEPRSGGQQQRAATKDLIFLDLNEAPAPRRPTAQTSMPPVAPPAPTKPAPPAKPTPAAPLPSALADLPLVEPAPDESLDTGMAEPSAGTIEVTHAADLGNGAGPASEPAALDGLEPTQFSDEPTAPSGSILDLEPTSFGTDSFADVAPPAETEPAAAEPEPELLDFDAAIEMPAEPLDLSAPPSALDRSPTPTHGADVIDGGDLDLILPEEPAQRYTPRTSGEILADLEPPLLRTFAQETQEAAPAQPPQAASAPATPDVDTGADIPLLDFEIPDFGAEAPRRPSTEIPELTLHDDLDANVAAAAEEAERAAAEAAAAAEAEAQAAEAAAIPPVEIVREPEIAERPLEFVVPADEVPADEDEDIAVELSVESEPAPPVRRSSTMFAAQSVEILQAAVEGEPENWSLRRELAEAMLDAGDREGGIHELETAMAGAERSSDLDLASRIADEIARIDPGTVKHLQKRVEYAFRTNDKPRLIEAYLALGEALGGSDQIDKARAVYQRVLDLAPDDIRAQAALEALPSPEPIPEPAPAPAVRRSTTASKPAAPPPSRRSPPPRPQRVADDSFVNLGDMLRDEVGPADTRMVVEEHEPTGDEEADFQDMLRKFKQGIAQNVEQEDYQSHYDLGIAFKEMGLVDEAIAEFQKALRSPTNRVPTYEALGQCFIEKEQYPIASTVLSRALAEDGMTDDQLVGVLYLLGRAAEALNRREEALTYYQRVFLVDIQFRDVADRISQVERGGAVR